MPSWSRTQLWGKANKDTSSDSPCSEESTLKGAQCVRISVIGGGGVILGGHSRKASVRGDTEIGTGG